MEPETIKQGDWDEQKERELQRRLQEQRDKEQRAREERERRQREQQGKQIVGFSRTVADRSSRHNGARFLAPS